MRVELPVFTLVGKRWAVESWHSSTERSQCKEKFVAVDEDTGGSWRPTRISSFLRVGIDALYWAATQRSTRACTSRSILLPNKQLQACKKFCQALGFLH